MPIKLLVFIEVMGDGNHPRGSIGGIEREYDEWPKPCIGEIWGLEPFSDGLEIVYMYHYPDQGRIDVQLESQSAEILWEILDTNKGWINSDQ